jgi:uncharacterized protein
MDLPEDDTAAGPTGDPDLDCPEPVEVPWEVLSPDALRGVVENFVLREGTDYGDREFSHEQKVLQVLESLRRGESRVLFDPETSTVTLLPRE